MLTELRRRKAIWSSQSADTFLTGLVVPRLALALMKQAGIQTKDKQVAAISDNDIVKLRDILFDFRLTVTKVRGF